MNAVVYLNQYQVTDRDRQALDTLCASRIRAWRWEIENETNDPAMTIVSLMRSEDDAPLTIMPDVKSRMGWVLFDEQGRMVARDRTIRDLVDRMIGGTPCQSPSTDANGPRIGSTI